MEKEQQEHHAQLTVLRSVLHVFPDITYPVHHVLRICANVQMETAQQEHHAQLTVLRSVLHVFPDITCLNIHVLLIIANA